MGLVMLQVLCFVVKVCAIACSLFIQGSAGYNIQSQTILSPIPHIGDRTPGHVINKKPLRSNAPAPTFQRNDSFLHPPLALPPLKPSPVPQTINVVAPSMSPSTPTVFPSNTSAPTPMIFPGIVPSTSPSVPQIKQPRNKDRVLVPQPPDAVPVALPSSQSPQNPPVIRPSIPVSMPPISHRNKTLVPLSPQIAPAQIASPPLKLAGNSPPIHPTLPKEPPSNLPGPNISPALPPSPSTNRNKNGMPVAAPPSRMPWLHSPVDPSPKEAPSMHKDTRYHHAIKNITSPAPSTYLVPPPLTEQGPFISPASYFPISDPKNNRRPNAPPPLHPAHSPFPSTQSHISPPLAPSPASQSGQTKMPFLFPKISPSGSAPRNPNMPLLPPIQALPPPPPNKDCTSISCVEPLTNTPPGSPCGCVLPMQVGLRLSVALYTFFPLVSELAVEIAAGVFMKQSQVRIMGANAASQDPEKSIVLLDLVPLGENFDFTTAYLTYQRFWHKEVAIKTSFFGDYEVLYVRYPGLPPSPPSAPSSISIIDGEPYPGHEKNASAIHPLGVDVSRRQHKDGLNRSIVAIIVLSASIAVIFLCAIAWILLLKHRNCVHQPEPTSTMQPSLPKSSGIVASLIGSGPSSASLSFGSSLVPYNGSSKTFSSSDIERATDNFNASRILGEGGFGRVYSGVLEDGTKVAVKVLKRDDQQGGREFLAEIEMLSRLHHRNLVKLIGICTEERSRCLVYELIPNGSVESHLHGIHQETAPLDWGARLKIALGAARGLAYLHEDSSPRVIHRDFKSSNILLECDYMPKVSDFGLARTALDEENRHIITRVMGTFGYVAPEYAMTGHLLVKSDVYSYGVVLLELLTGRKPVDMSQPPGEENLVAWARPLLATKEGLESIIDLSLGPDFPFDSIAKVAAIASMCVQPEVSHRPFMGEVVQALKLVCHERDETNEYGSRSCSQDDFSIDLDARVNTNSGHSRDPLQTPSLASDYCSRIDLERGLSLSELLSESTRYGRQESGSFRRHSSSGPLRTGRSRWLWQTMRLSGGGMSDPRLMFRFWHGSH